MRWITYIAITLLVQIAVDGQADPIRAVVLINGTPTVVDLDTDGAIVATIAEIPDYFTSARSHQSIVQAYQAKETISTEPTISFFDKEEEPVVPYAEENRQPLKLGAQQFIGFSPNRALLKDSAVEQIRKIADASVVGQISRIIIYSYHQGSYRSRSLARNRADAIKDLLGAFGVRYQLIDIQIETLEDQGNPNFVKISI